MSRLEVGALSARFLGQTSDRRLLCDLLAGAALREAGQHRVRERHREVGLRGRGELRRLRLGHGSMHQRPVHHASHSGTLRVLGGWVVALPSGTTGSRDCPMEPRWLKKVIGTEVVLAVDWVGLLGWWPLQDSSLLLADSSEVLSDPRGPAGVFATTGG